MNYAIRDYLQWQKWVVPRLLRNKPIHNWLVFPHSFTDDLVKALLEEWEVGNDKIVLDPFSGAGTTLVAAKELGIPAIGTDLSHFSELVVRAKITSVNPELLREGFNQFRKALSKKNTTIDLTFYPELVRKALPEKKLTYFHLAKAAIVNLNFPESIKDLLMLALISLIPKYSNAVATGGWLSWKKNERPAEHIESDLFAKVHQMSNDIRQNDWATSTENKWLMYRADARALPVNDNSVYAVITSPPYPNRHDYTRVFAIELMFGFLDWEQTRSLRYQTLESHPESKPIRPNYSEFVLPSAVEHQIEEVSKVHKEARIPLMLRGYFIDLYICIKEMYRVLKKGGHCALVLGNAQYAGIPIEVDIAAAEIGERAGFSCEEIRIARLRGNSAQQMRVFGRMPSRESVVLFRK